MTNRFVGMTTGIMTGILIGGAVGASMKRSGKSGVRRISRKTGRTLNVIGAALQSVADIIK